MNTFSDILSLKEIAIRIGMAIIIGGMIGYERGHQNRPAGFRTHILVCLGATIVSLIQDQLRIDLHNYVLEFPEVGGVVKTDLGRIGAQVVSGIGFLGAGTIMRDRGIVGGLTTAASIWATGCLGIGIGWGFYSITIPAAIAVIVVLVILKKLEVILIDNKHIIKIEIEYKDGYNYTQSLLNTYTKLKEMNVYIKKMDKKPEKNKVKCTLVLPKQINSFDVIAELSIVEYIEQVLV